MYGNPMYKIKIKLKNTKNALKIWSRNTFGNGCKLSSDIRIQLEQTQKETLANPTDLSLLTKEHAVYELLLKALDDENGMVKQKLGRDFFFSGDRNTEFFHRSLKIKQAKAQITLIIDMHRQIQK